MFEINPVHIQEILVSSFFVYFATVAIIRIVGLISFSKMASVDFAVTIAVGSIIASVILPKNASLAEGAICVAMLFSIQFLNSFCRSKFSFMSKIVDNQPLLLMKDGKILDKNLAKAKITKEDLYAKLREANALQLSSVRAVVFESTGDVSVLHGKDQIDDEILSNVRT